MRDPIDEGAGLSGPGARDDQQRTIPVRGRGTLLGVELGREIARIGGNLLALSSGVDARNVSHARKITMRRWGRRTRSPPAGAR
jgi:hypothetical protein